MTAAFKLVVVLLIVFNVGVHGTIALFIAGPPGLVAFLLIVAGAWGGGWVATRHFRRASEEERAGQITAGGVEGDEHA